MKVKPKKGGRVRRRVVTISIYAFAWVLLTVLAPFWLVGAAVIGVFRARSFVLLRLLIFAWFYFGFELIALLLVAGVTIRRLDVEPRMDALYRLQAWWASVNLRVAQRLLRLRIEVEGAELALCSGGPSSVPMTATILKKASR